MISPLKTVIPEDDAIVRLPQIDFTDAEREWAYDRQSHVGKLDKALDEAPKRGWVVVNMQQDWKTILTPAKRLSRDHEATAA